LIGVKERISFNSRRKGTDANYSIWKEKFDFIFKYRNVLPFK